jgi:hypothetical protein
MTERIRSRRNVELFVEQVFRVQCFLGKGKEIPLQNKEKSREMDCAET